MDLQKDHRASQLAREAKGLGLELKELLKERKTSDSDLEFIRNKLRRTHLALIFNHPYAPQSQGVDNLLWLETTHAFIQAYRAKLTSLEKVISVSGPPPRRKRGGGKGSKESTEEGQQRAQAAGPVEMRKALTEFRKFLNREERFWKDLVSRLVDVFDLQEARPALRALHIPLGDEGPLFSAPSRGGEFDRGLPSADPMTFSGPTGAEADLNASQKDRILMLVHKAFICCGDLARYAEQYKEERGNGRGSGRGKGARGGNAGRPGAGKGGHAPEPAYPPKDYASAAECYHQARLLMPDYGNPSNQLAVISTYTGDVFSSTYHYYRALCVRQPFDNARPNLEKTLLKAVESWRKVKQDAARPPTTGGDEEITVLIFKRDFVALHGLFYLRTGARDIPELSARVLSQFSSLVSARSLFSDQIVKVAVTGLGALWTSRLYRDGGGSRERSKHRRHTRPASSESGENSASDYEKSILLHVLGVYQVLMDIGTTETRDVLESASGGAKLSPVHGAGSHAVAQKISATFRRTLPALRIASKWTKSHLDYIGRSSPCDVSSPNPATGTEVQTGAQAIKSFWHSYVNFVNMLRFSFPFDALPDLTSGGAVHLEEDIDMRGFAPVKRGMFDERVGVVGDGLGPNASANAGITASQVHPNEEQLMRIADLLVDAKLVAESEASPVYFDDAHNTFMLFNEDLFLPPPRPVLVDTLRAPPAEGEAEERQGEREVALDEGSIRDDVTEATEDDPVNMAMRAVARRAQKHADGETESSVGDQDEEGETILIPQRSKPAPVPSSTELYKPPTETNGATTPQHGQQTAQDLLLQMLNGPPSGRSGSTTPPRVSVGTHSATPHLLFGQVASYSTNSPVIQQNSIWSPSPGTAPHPAQMQMHLPSTILASTQRQSAFVPTPQFAGQGQGQGELGQLYGHPSMSVHPPPSFDYSPVLPAGQTSPPATMSHHAPSAHVPSVGAGGAGVWGPPHAHDQRWPIG